MHQRDALNTFWIPSACFDRVYMALSFVVAHPETSKEIVKGRAAASNRNVHIGDHRC